MSMNYLKKNVLFLLNTSKYCTFFVQKRENIIFVLYISVKYSQTCYIRDLINCYWSNREKRCKLAAVFA